MGTKANIISCETARHVIIILRIIFYEGSFPPSNLRQPNTISLK